MGSIFANTLERAFPRNRTADFEAEPAPADKPAAVRTETLVRKLIVRGGQLMDERGERIFNGWLNPNNPAAYNQDIYARTSNAAAHGVMSVSNDTALYDLYDEMADRDLAVSTAERLISRGVAAMPARFFVDEAIANTPALLAKAQEIRDAAERDFIGNEGDFGLGPTITTAARATMRHGFAVFELVWAERNGRLTVKDFVHVHPTAFTFNDDGDLQLANESGEKRTPPPHKFMLSRLDALYGNAFGQSDLHVLRWLYHFKKYALRGWISYNDNHGSPLVVITVPDSAEDDPSGGWYTKAETILKNLTSLTGFVLPSNLGVEVHSRQAGQARSVHVDTVEWADRQIMRYIMGGTLATTEGQDGAGSYAQSQTHEKQADLVRVPLAKTCDRAFNRGPMASWVALNFGEQFVGMVRYETDFEDEQDVDTTIKILDAAQKADLALSKSEVYNMLGLTIPNDEDVLQPSQKEIYQYHIMSGVVTVNEIRSRLGFPPMDGGDAPVDPARLAMMGGMPTDPSAGGGMSASNLDGGNFAEAMKRAAEKAKAAKGEQKPPGDDDPPKGGTPKDEPKAGDDAPEDGVGAEFAAHACGCQGGLARAARPFADSLAEFAAPVGQAEIRKAAEAYARRVAAIADELYSANQDELAREVNAALDRLRGRMEDAPLTLTAEQVAAFVPPALLAEAETALIATRGLAMLSAYEVAERFLPEGAIPGDVELDPYYRNAADWMVERKIASRSDVAKLAKATSLLDSGRPPEQFERQLREKIFALKDEIPTHVAEQWRNALAEAVGRGDTVGEFITRAYDPLVADGTLAPGMEGYLRTVYRTEMSAAYNAERRAYCNEPIMIEAGFWGREFFNAGLPSSRPTHVAMDGVIVRNGSEADIAAGDPPWSYNCTCSWSPIMVADLENPSEEETPDALGRALAIERFDS